MKKKKRENLCSFCYNLLYVSTRYCQLLKKQEETLLFLHLQFLGGLARASVSAMAFQDFENFLCPQCLLSVWSIFEFQFAVNMVNEV